MKNTDKLIPIILAISLGLIGIFGGSVQAQMEMNDYLGFHLTSSYKKKSLEIPFKQYHNLIVIPLLINGSDTLNFVLDTGVGYTLLTDPNLIDELNLDCNRTVEIAGAGGEQVLNACISLADSIWFGEHIVAKKQNVLVLEKDVLHLSRYAGVKIHGLIGHDLFSRFIVNINYPKKTLTIYDPNQYKFKRRGYEVFPLSIEYMKPYMNAEAVFKGDASAPVKLILDIGAGHSLSLEAGSHPNIQVPDKNIKAQIGMALGGEIYGSFGRINMFKMGSFNLPGVITAFPDSSSLPVFKGLADRQGNLGSGVLNRFHITFDYIHKRVMLKRNRQYKKPFDFNTSGIEVLAEGPNYSIYKISEVRFNSPAYQSGLRRGDQIVGIDTEFMATLNLNRIYKLLNKKAGKKTKVYFLRGEDINVVEFVVDNPLE